MEKTVNQMVLDSLAKTAVKDLDSKIMKEISLKEENEPSEETKEKLFKVNKAFHTTDLDKWRNFLNRMNIPFVVSDDNEYDDYLKKTVDIIRIDIGAKESLSKDRGTAEFQQFYGYGTEFVSILFNKDETFKYFEALGE